MKKVSDIISEFFEMKEANHVFLLSGGMMMHLLDSISKSKSIKYICNHHEQASSIAAEAYARVSGKVGLCYATSGPGSTNIVTGVAGAWLDSVPVMYITGQSRTSLTVRGARIENLRMLGNFEVNILDIVKPITKYAAVVDDANEILYELEKAYHIAKEGRPGPVLLDIPLDIQGAMVDLASIKRFSIPENEISVGIDKGQMKFILEKLLNAKRPLIIGGHGIRVANQVAVFRKFITNVKIPVVTTQLANDLIQYDHECYIGKIGLRGDRAGNFAVQTADFILTLGTSLHVTTVGYEVEEFAPNAFKILVDIDKAVLEKNKLISDLQINQDVSLFLKCLVDEIGETDVHLSEKWFKRLTLIKSKYAVIKENHHFDNDRINTYTIIDTISNLLLGNEIIVTDAGSLYYIIGQTFKIKSEQRLIISGALGAMGYALPATLGACFAEPEKQVICITGDGSMQTNIQELQTISNYNPNCKIIVINNNGYASIRNSQASFLDGHLAASSDKTGVTFPDWEAVSGSYKIPFRKVDKASELKQILNEVFEVKGPLFLEIVIPENVTMIPSVISRRLEDGRFLSNMLHDMSPTISNDDILDIKFDL